MAELNLSLNLFYDDTEETRQRVISLANEVAQDVLDSHKELEDDNSPVTFEDAIAALFTEPGGPERLIDLEGVDGWSVWPTH